MLRIGKRLASTLLKTSPATQFASFSKSAEVGKTKSLRRKVVPIVLISLTGGVALSALNDLAIYHGCSRYPTKFVEAALQLLLYGLNLRTFLLMRRGFSKAMEKACQNKEIIDVLGEPIVKGPWYNASFALAHRRHSLSCTFPVSGPQGTGVFQLKAVRHGENTWFSFLRHQDWDIIILEALLHVPGNEEYNQSFRMSLSENTPLTASKECTSCNSQESRNPDKG